MNKITEMTIFSRVGGEGAENYALSLSCSAPVDASSLSERTFSVFGRDIVRSYVSGIAEPGCPGPGKYIILELDPVSDIGRVRGMGEHINIELPSLAVTQEEPFLWEDGTAAEPDGIRHIALQHRNPDAERFTFFDRGTLKYNLYVPENPVPGETYPLLLFIHDAGCEGSDPRFTLYQGCGATAFAGPQDQALQKCFVLAPQVRANCRMTTDDFTVTPELEEIMDTVRYVMEKYPVDPDRVLTTGQSMGCMASCELLCRYPDFFAGALLAAGQWDPERLAKTGFRTKLWILVSAGDRGAFPGMNAVTEALERSGRKISRYQWNGKAGKQTLEELARSAAADGSPVKYTVFDRDSVATAANSGPGANHGGTWALVYTIDAVRRWLTSQKREGKA
ncbi:MAG: prolyl oligopeptidase family serine peptidase [Oscillospiraceae bacterium]|nr:prolyl oligopeptidase family serine peptidase [Oscillospiraceae bacterium]